MEWSFLLLMVANSFCLVIACVVPPSPDGLAVLLSVATLLAIFDGWCKKLDSRSIALLVTTVLNIWRAFTLTHARASLTWYEANALDMFNRIKATKEGEAENWQLGYGLCFVSGLLICMFIRERHKRQ
jgi:hypothetical protein